jgi:hypothetical protein
MENPRHKNPSRDWQLNSSVERGNMALYFSAHTTACLTKQALKQLMQQLLEARDIKVQRIVSSQIGGRMLIETEAPNQPALEKFFAAHLLNCEWVMRIDLDAREEGIREY